ncbi:SusC/RagA family TonB-linked outer membrane protein [Marinifilum fragile]|uniref:SusC/RagA family TonB-linked outer membrane protein n=2 Tax=Marinifilum fragile TaxID=570161 RepID=UPI002AA87367|nr:SusC/RagA family TonB-linked outer membrane protein [Marinifilum fragile]
MKIIGNWRVLPPSIRKIVRVMKISVFLVLVCTLQLSASVMLGQQVSLQSGEMSVREVFKELKAQTGTYFMFSEKEVDESLTVNANFSQVSLKEALDVVCKQTSLKYEIIDDYVLITKGPRVIEQKQEEKKEVRGKVTDEKGEPLPGASVVVKETTIGVSTNLDGEFKLKIPNNGKVIILISSIGYKTKEIKVGDKLDFKVKLEPDTEVMSEVVVTGYFNKAKESFTGTTVAVSSEELEKLGNVDVFTAIQSFDASFKIVENDLMGSDPNSMPNIQIRGQANFPGISETELKGNTNMPTFILDGFEVSAQKVFDIDKNRIASITILKDASATAIYGSRAANGVVVIETKKPLAGKMQVTYNSSIDISLPDLSDYNLLNAKEKLEAEKLAGVYDTWSKDFTGMANQMELDALYNKRLLAVKSGVDTYWLAKPLQTSVGQMHSLFLEGGDEFMRYGLEMSYNKNVGVMKGSGRDRYNTGVYLQYNTKNIVFKNKLDITYVKAKNSPYGNFSQYVRLNPYYRPTDDKGNMVFKLGEGEIGSQIQQYNPLYEVENFDSFDRNEYIDVRNNLSVDWKITPELRLKGNASISKKFANAESFVSPGSVQFIGFEEKDFFQRGSYTISDTKTTNLDANVVLSYFKNFNNHVINAVLGGEIQSNHNFNEGYTAVGFLNDKLSHINFANQFRPNSKPTGYDSKSRLAGSFLSFNYSYDNRYLFDASSRIDGSSKFGKLQQTAPFWSLGTGWNLHNEEFMKDNFFLSSLKLTANLGTSGNQNFDAYQAITTYHYLSDVRYGLLTGAVLKSLGNEDLKWQSTLSRNLGIELGLLDERLKVVGNYYLNTTHDLLTNISVAPSLGFRSFNANMGDVDNEGYELRVQAFPIRNKENGMMLSFFANLRHNKNTIKKISNSLKAYNDKVIENMRKEIELDNDDDTTNDVALDDRTTTESVLQFKEGQSLNAIYAVRSMGIDPTTGEEILIKKDGSLTNVWSPEDLVVVGEAAPKFEGFFGGAFDYKGFSLNYTFNYRLGGQIFNQTVIDRVENANIFENADKRVLEQRWARSGDHTPYKNITSKVKTRASSRFVEDDNSLSLTNVNLSYQLPDRFANSMSLSRVKLGVHLTDVFRLSSVEIERGIYYPFARKYSFSLKVNF